MLKLIREFLLGLILFVALLLPAIMAPYEEAAKDAQAKEHLHHLRAIQY